MTERNPNNQAGGRTQSLVIVQIGRNRHQLNAEVAQELDRLQRQNAELLAALRGCVSLLECHEADPINAEPQCMQDARAAIARAKGGEGQG